MSVQVDAAGNIRGCLPGVGSPTRRRLFIGSHLDTVPRAGAFDGVLGVVMAVALVESLGGRRLPFRHRGGGLLRRGRRTFRRPVHGQPRAHRRSRPRADRHASPARFALSDSIPRASPKPAPPTTPSAISSFTSSRARCWKASVCRSASWKPSPARAACKWHFKAKPTTRHHADALPPRCAGGRGGMDRRRGAGSARRLPDSWPPSDASRSSPAATNVIAGSARASLDVRHRDDAVRHRAVERLLRHCAQEIAARRSLAVPWEHRLDHAAVADGSGSRRRCWSAPLRRGHPVHPMTSGAGHDAMIVALACPPACSFCAAPAASAIIPRSRSGRKMLRQLSTWACDFWKSWRRAHA